MSILIKGMEMPTEEMVLTDRGPDVLPKLHLQGQNGEEREPTVVVRVHPHYRETAGLQGRRGLHEAGRGTEYREAKEWKIKWK